MLRVISRDIVPLASLRAKLLPDALCRYIRERCIDALFIQEVWGSRFALPIEASLHEAGFHVLRPDVRSRFAPGVLLAVRNRFEVESTAFHPYQSSASSDRWMHKGILRATLRNEDGFAFALLGTHMQSFTTRDGNACRDTEIRAFREQVLQLKACLGSLARESSPPVAVLGDFNVGPGYVEDHFDLLLRSCNLKKPYLELYPRDFEPTWDQTNPLVRMGWNAAEPSSLIDHCFTRDGARHGWEALSGRIAMRDCYAQLQAAGAPQGAPLSDHYAMEVELRAHG